MAKYKLSLEIEHADGKLTHIQEQNSFHESVDECIKLSDLALSIYQMMEATTYSEVSIMKELIEVFGQMQGLPDNVIWNPDYKENTK